MKFIERDLKVVEAKQFTGGQKNFEQIVRWLYKNRYSHLAHNISWTPKIKLPGARGTFIGENLRISGYSGSGIQLPVGRWIVLGGAGDFDTVDQDEFEKLYEKKTDDNDPS